MTPAQVGTVSQPTSGQVNNFSGGNPNLVPEVANTLTIGAVWSPDSIRGLTASIDYFDIKVKKAILATPEQAIIDACYYAERVATGTFCSLIKRSAIDGTLEGSPVYGVDATRRNIGQLATRGIDMALNYKFDIGAESSLALGFNGTYMIDSKQQFANVLRTYECAGKVGKTCLNPQPRWAWTQTTAYETGPLLVQLTWRHIGPLENDTLTVGYNLGSPTDFVVPRIGAHDYFDLAARFKVNENFVFRFGVDNLFDKDPPVVGNDYGGTTQNSGNTFPATYDPIGRYFSAGVNVKF
jgi:outer membrane receptor protein involved in Fe transport